MIPPTNYHACGQSSTSFQTDGIDHSFQQSFETGRQPGVQSLYTTKSQCQSSTIKSLNRISEPMASTNLYIDGAQVVLTLNQNKPEAIDSYTVPTELKLCYDIDLYVRLPSHTKCYLKQMVESRSADTVTLTQVEKVSFPTKFQPSRHRPWP